MTTDLRELLHQAAPSVEPPPDGLDRAQRRAHAMRRRATAARVLAVPLAAVVLMATIAIARDDSRVRVGPADDETESPGATTTVPPGGSPVPTTAGAHGGDGTRQGADSPGKTRSAPGAAPSSPGRPAAAGAPQMVFGNTSGLWAMGLDGSGRRLVTSSTPSQIFGWAADGRHLLIGVTETANAAERNRTKVALLDVSNGTQRMLIDRPDYSVTAAAMSPDGRRLAYSAVQRTTVVATGEEFVYVADAAGNNPRAIVEGGGPAWSPDGNRLVIKCQDQATWTCVVNADGTGLRSVGWLVPPFAWSPDGKWIASWQGDELALIRPDGSGERKLALRAKGFSTPQWTPDSMRIVYARQVNNSRSDGSCPTPPCDEPPGIFATAVDRPTDHIRITADEADERPFVSRR